MDENEQSDYRLEIFMAGDDGPFWCSDEDEHGRPRTAVEAAQFVSDATGPAEDGINVARTTGRVEWRDGEGWWFTREDDPDTEHGWWEISV